ncbi:hypothetical protein RUM43_012246 [Polyplax serrata]|uniref:Uncharacterized protein n=1 Tax=Polyplax serrata TaxID=468196 RepID=A0AAN8NKD0_POLSC
MEQTHRNKVYIYRSTVGETESTPKSQVVPKQITTQVPQEPENTEEKEVKKEQNEDEDADEEEEEEEE